MKKHTEKKHTEKALPVIIQAKYHGCQTKEEISVRRYRYVEDVLRL